MGDFAISTNAHNPVVKSVHNLQDSGLYAINLGDPTAYNHVSLLVTIERWREIVRDVDQRFATMGAEKLDYSAVSDAVGGVE